MDLSQVKAAVKSWEKAFRAEHGRGPTKDDIKRDPSDIAEQYALYRRLTKASSSSQSQSQSQAQHSSQSLQIPSSSTSSSSQTRHTPRTIPSSEYPTTPTPTRRLSGRSSFTQEQPSAGPSRPPIVGNGSTSRRHDGIEVGTPKRSLKRTASRAAMRSSPPPSSDIPPLPSTSGRTLFTTPKKVAYSGPVYDPNPVNPFAISTPSRKSPLNSKSPSSSRLHEVVDQAGPSSSSPFIHASSPRKLKEVLEANSLRKVKERERVGMEITPRTRARKRLRGEPVEDTPLKDKQPRRRRGEGSAVPQTSHSANGTNGTNGQHLSVPRSGSRFPFEHDDEEHGSDNEDELGPSPLKAANGSGRSFASLFAETEARHDATSNGSSTAAKRTPSEDVRDNSGGKLVRPAPALPNDAIRRGRPSEMMGLFGRIGKSEKGGGKRKGKPENGAHVSNLSRSQTNGSSEGVRIAGSPSPAPAPATAPVISITESVSDAFEGSLEPNPYSNTSFSDTAGEESTRLPTPPPDPALEAAASQSTPSRSKRRDKVLSLSDDEEDEWDPEGGKVRRQVVIVPTRRAVRRGHDSDSIGASDEERSDEEEMDDSDEEYRSPSPSLIREGTTLSSTVASPTSLAPPLLSMLSLHSPQAPRPRSRSKKQLELEALRVRAIFDPLEAARLKAIKRGQEVRFLGQARAEGEEDDEAMLDKFDAGLVEEDHLEGAGEEGDDDWESESEGWKRTAEGLDDEVW